MATPRVGAASEADRLQSVKRALAVLEALAGWPGGATPKELSQTLGLHLSTCYRLLNTLIAAGYVVRSPENGLFRLGPRIAYLNHGFLEALSPPAKALPFIHALQLTTGETAMLNQLQGDDVVITAVVQGTRPASHPPGFVGMAAPAHAMAAGRALLAWLAATELDAYLARAIAPPESPFPLRSPAALRAELERIRAAGYAVDQGEAHPEVCCVAAPVLEHDGKIGSAVSVVVPSIRFGHEEPSLVAAVVAVARAIGSLQVEPSPHDRSIVGTADEPSAATQAEIEAALATMTEVMSRVNEV